MPIPVKFRIANTGNSIRTINNMVEILSSSDLFDGSNLFATVEAGDVVVDKPLVRLKSLALGLFEYNEFVALSVVTNEED